MHIGVHFYTPRFRPIRRLNPINANGGSRRFSRAVQKVGMSCVSSGSVVLPITTTDKKITLLPVFVGGRKIRDDQLGIGAFGNVQEALYGLLHTKEVQEQSYVGNPETFIPKDDKQPDQNAPEIGRKLGRTDSKVLQDAFDKGMQRKAEAVLEGRLKDANHLRHLDDVRSKGIEAPNMNTRGGPIARGEGMSKKGLDSTKAHSLGILHNNPQVVRTARVPNLTGLVLAFAKRVRRSR